MAEKKLIIQSQKYSGDTTVISLRLPKDMLNDIDAVVEKTGKSRNEILQMFLVFSLENLQIEN